MEVLGAPERPWQAGGALEACKMPKKHWQACKNTEKAPVLSQIQKKLAQNSVKTPDLTPIQFL